MLRGLPQGCKSHRGVRAGVSAILAGMLGVEPVPVSEPEDGLPSFKPG